MSSPPSVLSRPSRSDVRARILAAAAAAFLASGYTDTTVTGIAAGAGFTKGAVYSNFGSKPELFCAVFADRTAAVADLALSRTGIRSVSSGRRSLADVARSLTEQVTASSPWPSLLTEFRVLALRDPEVGALYGRLRLRQCEQVAEELRSLADALELPDSFDFPTAANLIYTVTGALATEHAAAPEAIPAALVEASLTHLLESLVP